MSDLIEVNMEAMCDHDMAVVILRTMVPGHSGDDFLPVMKRWLRDMAKAGMWPVDWMDDPSPTHIALWFKWAPVGIATQQCEHFIKKGGYV